MDMLQQLRARYERYAEEAGRAAAKASPAAGLLGMGNDPRKDPCHMGFYEDVEQWVKRFLAAGPDADAAWQAARWMLSAAAEHRDQAAYGFMYAAQGLCREILPLISREGCADLAEFYDAAYPCRDRLPVQKEIYKLLCKGARKK